MWWDRHLSFGTKSQGAAGQSVFHGICSLFREHVPFMNSAIRGRSICLLSSQATAESVLGQSLWHTHCFLDQALS